MAMRAGVSEGRLVAVRASVRTSRTPSAARDGRPRKKPIAIATSHQTAATRIVVASLLRLTATTAIPARAVASAPVSSTVMRRRSV